MSDPPPSERRNAQLLRYVTGGILVIVGIGTLFFGGYVAAFTTPDGIEPNQYDGFLFCFGGLILIGLGLRLCGVDWHDV